MSRTPKHKRSKSSSDQIERHDDDRSDDDVILNDLELDAPFPVGELKDSLYFEPDVTDMETQTFDVSEFQKLKTDLKSSRKGDAKGSLSSSSKGESSKELHGLQDLPSLEKPGILPPSAPTQILASPRIPRDSTSGIDDVKPSEPENHSLDPVAEAERLTARLLAVIDEKSLELGEEKRREKTPSVVDGEQTRLQASPDAELATDEIDGASQDLSTSEEATPQVSFNESTGRIRILPDEDHDFFAPASPLRSGLLGSREEHHSLENESFADEEYGESLPDELPVRSIPQANSKAWEPASDAFAPDMSSWTLGPREEVTATLFASPPANDADHSRDAPVDNALDNEAAANATNEKNAQKHRPQTQKNAGAASANSSLLMLPTGTAAQMADAYIEDALEHLEDLSAEFEKIPPPLSLQLKALLLAAEQRLKRAKVVLDATKT